MYLLFEWNVNIYFDITDKKVVNFSNHTWYMNVQAIYWVVRIWENNSLLPLYKNITKMQLVNE